VRFAFRILIPTRKEADLHTHHPKTSICPRSVFRLLTVIVIVQGSERRLPDAGSYIAEAVEMPPLVMLSFG
jgi:hypothetical protein